MGHLFDCFVVHNAIIGWYMKWRSLAEKIFLAGVERVLPGKLIAEAMHLDEDQLFLGDLSFSLKSVNNIYVIGAGKATALMASEAEKILDDRITDGFISVKYGHGCKLEYIKTAECGHPIPDRNGFAATANIIELAGKAEINDLVISLFSGGGSALLADFPEGSSADELIRLNGIMVNCGASIDEINTVRKHLSSVKGGGLARAIYPASLVSLILSDVPGDQSEVIASGPVSPDPTTFSDAFRVIEKYDLTEIVPFGIIKYLKNGIAGLIAETPKPGDKVFDKAFSRVIGNNRMALNAAATKASDLGFNTEVINELLLSDVAEAAQYVFDAALTKKADKDSKPVCLIFGGETSVKMTGNGLGGRNQHLALLIASKLQNNVGITILAAGTDGSDGPTDAAGAVVDSDTMSEALIRGMDIGKYISDFNSYNFFKETGGHIITGPTLTNVMDIIVVLIW